MQRQTIGIIGGGQLGRMLIQAGINYPIDFHVYSNSEEFSSKGFCKALKVAAFTSSCSLNSASQKFDRDNVIFAPCFYYLVLS